MEYSVTVVQDLVDKTSYDFEDLETRGWEINISCSFLLNQSLTLKKILQKGASLQTVVFIVCVVDLKHDFDKIRP